MQQNSLFVKIVIWSMVFLMSIGFIGLVIAPFVGNTNLFGSSGRDATQELVDEARADIKADDCNDEDKKFSKAELTRCKEALTQLASAYTTLARPEDETATELPRDAQRNIDRAGQAIKRLYEIDTTDENSTVRYAGYLRDTGDAAGALELWTGLVKENPTNEDYLLQQAGAYSQTQELDKAIATLRLYLKKFPDAGQAEAIEEEIKNLQEQKEQQAAGGGAGAAPVTIG